MTESNFLKDQMVPQPGSARTPLETVEKAMGEERCLLSRVKRSRLRKWIVALFLLLIIGLCFTFLIGTLKISRQLPARSVLSDRVSLLPLVNFEFSEPSLFSAKQTGESAVLSDGRGWKEHVFHKKTSYKVEAGKNGDWVLHALSQGTSSLLFRPVDIKLSDRPFLTWEWNAIQFPSRKSNKILAAKSDNDFAARVYAVFHGRTPFSSDIIQYVWDDHFPEGAYAESPYSNRVRIFVVQNGRANGRKGDWVFEKRDLLKDYKMLYGKPPQGNLIAVGLMSDSDNTGTASEAYYRRLSIQKPKNLSL